MARGATGLVGSMMGGAQQQKKLQQAQQNLQKAENNFQQAEKTQNLKTEQNKIQQANKTFACNTLLSPSNHHHLVDKNSILQTQPGNKTSKTKPAKQRA